MLAMIEDTGIVDCCFILVECLHQKNTRRSFILALLVLMRCGDTQDCSKGPDLLAQ